jgi:hypothetical protein
MLRWRPDTCSCVLEYNGSNEKANLAKVVNLCPSHANADEAHDDNILKNRAVGKVHEAVVAKDPSVGPEEISWRFDRNRQLFLKVPSRTTLNVAERVLVQTELTQLSAKVVLE